MGHPIPESASDGFDALVARAEELTRVFEQHPNAAVREDALELLGIIDTIHRDAILRFVDLVIQGGSHELIHTASEDPQVCALLTLYDVLPLPELVRWQETLDAMRPLLKERGADIELMRITDGMPHLRVKGGFTTGETEFQQIVQEAIAASFGGYQSVRWEPREKPPAPQRFVPISAIQPAKRQSWVDLMNAADLPLQAIRKFAVKDLIVLLCRSESGNFAFPDACPGTALPLHMGRIEGDTIVCPWHSCKFDIRSGKRTAGTGMDLKPLTLRNESGRLQLGTWQ